MEKHPIQAVLQLFGIGLTLVFFLWMVLVAVKVTIGMF